MPIGPPTPVPGARTHRAQAPAVGGVHRFESGVPVDHELRTPLTVLSGELELLLEHTPSDSQEALGLQRAVDQVEAMRELVEAILLLHRSGEAGADGPGAFEVLNLGDLAREALAEVCQRHAGRAADAHLTAPDEVLFNGRTLSRCS